MKAVLKKEKNELYYYDENGVKQSGAHDRISGDVSGLSGDVSWICGDVSGLSGDVSRISGDIDLCEITAEEREKGIDIEELIEKGE